MLIHLHIGLDKTGSTAIQYHMKENRNWYARKGVFIPETGFLFGGHQVLFKEMFPKNLGPLLKELDAVKSLGFDQFFFSWEGIWSMSAEQLGLIKDLFGDSEFIIYIYLREQSEIIQSGYLQNLKSDHSGYSLRDLKSSSSLNNEQRNYKKLLDKFSECFGQQSLRVRLYDKEFLAEGGVITDLLSTMGLEKDREFSELRHASNPSLDLPALRILDDIQQSDNADRKAIIDILRNDIAVNGTHEKYFLNKEETEQIKLGYLESNRAVASEYLGPDWPHPELFPHNKTTYITESEQSIEGVIASRKQLLATLQDYYTWTGKEISGTELGRLAPESQGWLPANASGVCSSSADSKLRFRIMWEALLPFHTGISLVLKFSQTPQASMTRLSINGVEAGILQSDEATIDIPLHSLDEYRRVEVQIATEAVAAEKTAEPGRECLEICSVRFDRQGKIP